MKKAIQDTRKKLMVGEQMYSAPVEKWTDEQRRLGGAWSKHELQSKRDKLCAAYDWRPEWTNLPAIVIQEQLSWWYSKQDECPSCTGFGWKITHDIFHNVQEACPDCLGSGVKTP